MNINVIKRDGRREKFDIRKIKRQIDFITKGTDVSSIEFESKLRLNLIDDIKTSDIQTLLALTAIKEANVENPDWLKVAGKAVMWDIYGTVYKTTGFNINDWYTHMKWLADNGYYKKEIIEKIEKLNLVEHINNNYDIGVITNIGDDIKDFDTVISRSVMLKNSYLVKDIDGNVIEYPFLMDIANSVLLSDTIEEFDDVFWVISNKYIQLATPFQRNLRRPNGNLGSCFIGEMEDSLASIMKSASDIAFISKNGGGVGWYLGKVRPSGARSKNIVKANEINLWIKILNDVIVAVNQAGVRKGALTVALDWWHMDIQSFLEIKLEDNGELRFKAFDIFPQVVVDSYFLNKVLNGDYVYLFDQYEVKNKLGIDVTELIDIPELNKYELTEAYELINKKIEEGVIKHYKRVYARSLWQKILNTWIAIGDQYIVDKNNLNKSNYLKYDNDNFAITKSANLCVESFSITKPATEWKEKVKDGERVTTETNGVYHSCNLLSINAARLVDVDYKTIEMVSELATTILDKSIDLTTPPVKEAEIGSKSLRNIGIGIVGLADYMAYHKALYDTEEGIKVGMGFVETLAYHIYKSSIKLAKKKGSYPLFNKNNYKYGLFGRSYEELNRISRDITGNNFNWSLIGEEIMKHGIRNFLLMAIAPNTSTSLLLGVTASYLPAHEKFFNETNSKTTIPVAPPYIKTRYWYYKTKGQYNPVDIIKFTRAIQTFIDTGISMELLINPDLLNNNIKELSKAIIDGFLSGELKAVYYSRSNSSGCSDCAN